MTDFEALKPCTRGCIRKGTEDSDSPSFLAARHGRFCDRCFYHTDRALRMAGALVEHVLGEVAGLRSKNTDGSQRSRSEPPLPFNVGAFNDANEIYSRLVYWVSLWATRLNRQPPSPAAHAWRTDQNRVVGLPNDIQPAAARYAVAIMGLWLSAHLDDIYALPTIGDIEFFQDDMQDVYRIAARWPAEDQAVYAPVRCPDDDCKGKIAIHPPKFAGDEQQIICESCGRVFQEDDYDRMASVFRQVRKEETKELLKANRVASRLAKKYGTA